MANSAISNLPYAKQLFKGAFDQSNLNDKFEVFADASVTREERVQRLSVVNEFDQEMLRGGGGGGMWINSLAELIYNSDSNDKQRRLQTYRTMGSQAEVADCSREICDEFITKDENGKIMQFELRGDYSEEVKELIKEEFYKFLNVYKLEDRGWQMMKDFLTEGEVFYENIVSKQKPELGIIGLTRISAERIDPFYYDQDNELIEFYVLKKKMHESSRTGKSTNFAYSLDKKNQLLFLNEKQITHAHSHDWDESNSKQRYRRPHLDYGVRPYRHLSLIEDATVIYMLVRAPERLVFNIDTGNLPPGKAEAYVKKQMAEFWTRRTVGKGGNPENLYDPMTMLENYYFPKPRGSDGSSVTSIGGGSASPDNMDMLTLFINRLYKALQVPLSRLNADSSYSDGMDVTREELRFALFVIRLQQHFAEAIKSSFITHLKLKGRKVDKQAKHFDNEQDMKKEFFDFTDWDNYDVLVEKNLASVEAEISNLEERINGGVERLAQIDDEVMKMEGLIMEQVSRDIKLDMLAEEHSQVLNQLGMYKDGIKELRADSESLWTEYSLMEVDIDMEFNKPSQFFALREQQIFNIKFESYASMAQDDLISTTLAQSVYLGWSDKQIVLNREHLKKDAAFRWELGQIEQMGPDFREKAANELEGAMGMEGGAMGGAGGPMGGDLGGDLGGGAGGPAEDTDLPEFGGSEAPGAGDIASQELGGEPGSLDMPDLS